MGSESSRLIVRPDSSALTVWSLVVHVALAWVCIIVPLECAWDDHFRPRAAWAAANIAFDIVFIVDVFIASRTAFFFDGMLIDEPTQVLRHYLRTRFALDAVVSAPFGWFIAADTLDGQYTYHSGTPALVRALRLLRLLRVVPRLLRNDTLGGGGGGGGLRALLVSRMNPSAARALQLVALLVLACHWTGCLWWLVGTLECSVFGRELDPPPCDDGWGPDAALQLMPLTHKYAHAFVWGASLMTGLVPFDVVPVTTAQAWFTSICLFGGLLISIVTIASATATLTQLDQRTHASHARLEAVKRFLRDRLDDNDVARQIIDYYSYRLSSTVHSIEEVGSELRELPANLRLRLTLGLHGDLISNCVYFHALSTAASVALLEKLKPEVHLPGEIILREGHRMDRMYVIRRGVVRCWVRYGEPKQQLLATLVSNDFFCERSLVAEESSIIANATVQCVSYCDLLSLSRADARAVLERFPEAYQSPEMEEDVLESGVIRSATDFAVAPETDDTATVAEAAAAGAVADAAVRDERQGQRALAKLRQNTKPRTAESVDPAGPKGDERGISLWARQAWRRLLRQPASEPMPSSGNRSRPRLDLELAIQQVCASNTRASSSSPRRSRTLHGAYINLI